MKNWGYLFLCIIIACGQPNDNGGEQQSTDTLMFKSNDLSNKTVEVKHILRDIEDLFLKKNLRQYNCLDIEEFYYDNRAKLNTEGLTQVSDSLCQNLFGDYTNDFGTLCNSYFYSIDRPIHNFYPITIIQGFGVYDRPLVMVLFNEEKKIVNTSEVANYYGETGGCFKSVFINDSTIIQDIEWGDFGVDTITDEDIQVTTYVTQETTITSKGQIITKERSRWTNSQRN